MALNNSKIPIICPVCETELKVQSDRLLCERCGKICPIEDNIIIIEKAKYWGEIDKKRFSEILECSKKDGWYDTVLRFFKNKHHDPYLYENITSIHRATWTSLLPLSEKISVLDVAAGLGAVTHCLALQYDTVVALEGVEDRCRFISERIKQEGLTNVTTICASITNLPFPPACFDLIVLNGILEWIGEFDRSRKPRLAQLNFLRKVRRLLRPGGYLVVGIENRLGLSMARGRIDHSGVRYTSLMPRFIASFYLRHRGNIHYRTEDDSRDCYRTYTYTLGGYKKLFKEAGLGSPQSFSAEPGYNLPLELQPIDTKHAFNNSKKSFFYNPYPVKSISPKLQVKKIVKYVLNFTDMERRLVGDFVFIIPKDSNQEKQKNHPLAIASDSLIENDVAKDFYPTLITKRRVNKTVIIWHDKDGKSVLVQKNSNALHKGSADILDEYKLLIQGSKLLSKNPFLTSSTPLIEYKKGNQISIMESALAGKLLANEVVKKNFFRKIDRVKEILVPLSDALIQFHLASISYKTIAVPEVPKEFYDIPNEVREIEGLDKHIARIREIKTHTVLAHGDFTAINIILLSSNCFGIMDWQWLARGHPPLFDVFSLISSLFYCPEYRKREQSEVQAFLHTYFNSDVVTELFSELLFQHADAIGWPREDLDLALFGYLLVRFNRIRINYRIPKLNKLNLEYLKILGGKKRLFDDKLNT